MQTRNAVGNLVNRYRAVLKKCNIMNVFGSLAIAGMLVMGSSVGVASAAELTSGSAPAMSGDATVTGDGADKDITLSGIATGEKYDSITVSSTGAGSSAAKLTITATDIISDETNIKVDGGSSTGAEIKISEDADLGIVTLTGFDASSKATLTIDNSHTMTGTTSVGAFSVLALAGKHKGDVTLNGEGATLTAVTGTGTGIIANAAGTGNLNVIEGTVNVAENASVAGKTTLGAAATATAKNGTPKAAIINITAGKTYDSKGGTTVNTGGEINFLAGASAGIHDGSVTLDGGVINAKSTTASGSLGTINFSGDGEVLDINSGTINVTGTSNGTAIASVLTLTGSAESVITMDGGAINVTSGTGHAGADATLTVSASRTFDMNAGTIKITKATNDTPGDVAAFVAASTSFDVSGESDIIIDGALNIGSTALTDNNVGMQVKGMTVKDDAFVVANALVLTGAETVFNATTLYIDKAGSTASTPATGAWATTPDASLTGVHTGTYTHTNGTATVGELKMVAGGTDHVTGSFLNEIKIVDGEFNIDGGELTTIGHANRVEVNAGTFNVKGDVTVTKNGEAPGGILVLGTSNGGGNIGSGQYAATAGSIFIGGSLDAETGGAAFHGASDTAIATVVGTMKVQGSKVGIDTIIGDEGRDTFTGGATINLGALDIIERTGATGDVKLVLDSTQGDVNFIGVEGKDFFTGDEISTAKAGGLTFGKTVVDNPFGTDAASGLVAIKGGTTDATITTTAAGAFEVVSNNWTIGALNASTIADAAQINGGTLTINGTDGSFVNTESATKIGASGELVVHYDALLNGVVLGEKLADSDAIMQAGNTKITTVDGADLTISGLGEVDLDVLKAYAELVMDDGGGLIGVTEGTKINLGDAEIKDEDNDKLNGTISLDDAAIVKNNEVTASATATNASTGITQNLGVKNLVVENASTSTEFTVAVAGNMTLKGDGTDGLILVVNDKGDTLVKSEAVKVTVRDGKKLTLADGTGSLGEVNLSASGSLDIEGADSVYNVNGIAGSGNVTISEGANLKSTDDVTVGNITITGGSTLTADCTFTSTGTVTFDDGNIVTLYKPEQAANDGWIKIEHDITGTGSITAANYVEIDEAQAIVDGDVLTITGGATKAQGVVGADKAVAVNMNDLTVRKGTAKIAATTGNIIAGTIIVTEGAVLMTAATGNITTDAITSTVTTTSGQVNMAAAGSINITENLASANAADTFSAKSYDVDGTVSLAGGSLMSSANTAVDSKNTFDSTFAATNGATVVLLGETSFGGNVTLNTVAASDKATSMIIAKQIGAGQDFALTDAGDRDTLTFLNIQDVSKVTGNNTFTVGGNTGLSIGSMGLSEMEDHLAEADDSLTDEFLKANAGFEFANAVAISGKDLSLAKNGISSNATLGGTHSLEIGAGSLLIADVSDLVDLEKDALMTNGGNIDISTTAGVRLSAENGVKANKDYILVSDVTDVTQNDAPIADIPVVDENGDSVVDAPDLENVLTLASMTTDSRLVNLKEVSFDEENGNLVATTELVNAKTIFTKMDSSLADMINSYATNGTSINPFLELALNDKKIVNAGQAGNTIEGAAKLGVAGALIPSITAVGSAGSSNAQTRTSISSNYVANAAAMNFDGENTSLVAVADGDSAAGMKNGIGMWVMPMYQSHSADGLESGSYEYGYDTDFGGVSVGADYTLDNSLRLGASIHMGSGSSESTGDFAGTDNDFDYYGFSLYTGYHFGANRQWGVSADIGYTMTENEVDQSSMLGTLDSDMDSSLFTLGVRGEYKIALQALDITPHIGMRVNHVTVDSFDTAFGGATVAKTDETDATTVQFPIGATFSKEILTAGGWNVNPSLDLGVMFTAGDTDVEQDVRFTGAATSASMDSDIADAVTFQGGLGIGMSNGSVDLNLDYNINASSNVTSHGVFGTFRYNF